MDRIACAYCGSELIVEYSEGDMNLSLAQKIKETLQDVGQETQGAIRESTGVTQSELQRLQIGQQIGTLQIQLSSIRSEIRALEREKQLSRAAKGQLKDLRREEQECLLQIRNLQSFLSNKATDSQTNKVATNHITNSVSKPSRWKPGCIWGFVSYLIVGVLLSMIALPVEIASAIGFIVGIFVMLYFLFPEASIWRRLPIIGKSKTQSAGD